MAPISFMMLPVLILLVFAGIGLLILFIKLCIKKPWVAAIIALVFLFLLAPIFVLRPISHRRFINYRHQPELLVPSVIRSGDTTAAIWSPGIEDEFKANVYPSKVSAIRSVGLRIAEPVRQVFGDQALPAGFILFQGAHDRDLVEEFGRAIGRVFPGTNWTIKPETAAVQDDEVGIRLDLVDIQTQPAVWRSESESRITSATIRATVLAADKQTSISAHFVEKPWVDDFSGFLNNQPNRQFVIAKSSESCLSEAEANSQAMDNARAQVSQMLEKTTKHLSRVQKTLLSKVNSDDILEGGLVLDRFVQSFEGTAGKIWRQALLIDASAEKLTQLARRKADMARARKFSFVRTFSSIAGLLLLITVVYVFLNVATKGYYTWSLRIAGFVLALILIFLLLA